ncbi:MAG TPA: DUF58 domain-containing protein [Candidatus Limnocylindrales bacterium]|nr:DUF58 domain-containing protein [Candidatus Limnocylindrales bacterium]
MLRRLQLLLLAGVLLLAAFSTGAEFLFFLVYLGLLVLGGAYLVTRFGLADLEAGYALDRLHGHVGEPLRATYTLRNTGRLPKLWLEVHNPSTLPVPLPGRALVLGGRTERSWVARVPLTQRGHFRVDPLVIRTGDPFGFFEASASVGSGAAVTVYPRIEHLPRWRLPASTLEGTHASPERTLQSTPLVTSIRPYAPGDAYNRIHWKSSARQQELQVKEFDLEQTADAWLFLDLERSVHTGRGEESTLEAAVRVAASVAARALVENRAVGLTASGHRTTVLPADRGGRQHQKVMATLAAVRADGATPLVEALVQGLPRLRRGMTAVIVTPSVERAWVRPLAALRGRGVAAVVCLLDAAAYDERARRAADDAVPDATVVEERTRGLRAMRHALAEYDLTVHLVVPDRPLGELLVSTGPSGVVARL